MLSKIDFLEKQLDIIKEVSDGNLTWNDLNTYRFENGINEHLDSTRRNAKFLKEYLEAGWVSKPTENFPALSKKIISTNADGSQSSEDKFVVENEDDLRDSEYLLKLHGYVPTSNWEIVSSKSSLWDTQVKGGEVKKLYSSRVTVKPRNEVSLDCVKNILIENCKNYNHKSVKFNLKDSGKILEINLADCHLGKLCWAPETGSNYDHKIAVQRFKYIISDILNQVSHLDFEKIYFIWSNDFYHFDTVGTETTAGTRVESSVRWQKMFRIGVELLVWAIDEIYQKTESHVETFYIGSNHDKMTAYYSTNYLYAWYKDNPNVTVSYDCIARKFVEYGNVMLGFCHGSDEGKNISSIMAKEKPEIYGRTKFRYMQAAHYHSNYSRPIFEDCGCEVRYLSSPAGDDSWHYSKGFLGAVKCGYGFVYDKELGRRLEIRSNILT